MQSDTRNTKVVVALVLAMTAGAAVLLLLETPTRGWSKPTLLMAERSQPINDLLIDFAPAGYTFDPMLYDCLVYPDGRFEWQPRGGHVHLMVVGGPLDTLPAAQAKTLLGVIGSMHELRRLDLQNIQIHPDVDAALHDVPPQARDLRALLVRKAIIQ